MELNYWELNEKQDTSGSSLDGKICKFLNVFDNGGGPENKFVSFRNDNLLLRAIYNKDDGMPIKLVACPGMPDTYYLWNNWPGQNKWISFANDGKWLFARYSEKSDALPIKFKKYSENNNGTYQGPCYTMQGVWNGKDHDHISFTTDGSQMRMWYATSSAMTVVLVE